ncbi:MAG: carboxypeptidase regulatory-like domain-containing protein, partial [Thermoplasmata archaeon]
MSLRRHCLLLPLMLFGFICALWAQTTGGIVGAVTDESGAGLPGVTVEAKSPALQGSRATRTAADGLYRLTLLPPGQYVVTFALQEYSPETRSAITVNLGKDTTLDLSLRRAVREGITVVGQVPTVDTTSTSLGTNLDALQIQTLPTGRNYSSIVQVAPGISSDANPLNTDQSTITVYGSSGAENSYFIDGVNTTNLEYGFQGKELNYEFIQE